MNIFATIGPCEMDRSPENERVALKESTNLREGRFSYSEIYEYVAMRSYPEGFTKEDKLAIRKRSKYFAVKKENLYYVGGKYNDAIDCCYSLSQSKGGQSRPTSTGPEPNEATSSVLF